jgi:[protein-PII] uridylyltransferase
MARETEIAEFLDSMPRRYARLYDERVIARHAAVARERGDSLANVGWIGASRGRTALCISAVDQPGLLAAISAALVDNGLDVVAAEAYNRRVPGRPREALDLFWVRRNPPDAHLPVEPADVARVRAALVNLLARGTQSVLDRVASARATPASVQTVVRFVEDGEGRFVTLEIETSDRSGLLLAVCQALFAERVQIIGSRIVTRGRRVHDRFDLVELDESILSDERRRTVQVAVFAAVDQVASSGVWPGSAVEAAVS